MGIQIKLFAQVNPLVVMVIAIGNPAARKKISLTIDKYTGRTDTANWFYPTYFLCLIV